MSTADEDDRPLDPAEEAEVDARIRQILGLDSNPDIPDITPERLAALTERVMADAAPILAERQAAREREGS